MAGALAGGAIQTTFAALSFAGARFLFNKLNHTGYEAEIKRHNLSLEKLAAAEEAFYENEIRHKDRLAQLRAELSDANADINATNRALDKLRTYTSNGVTFRDEPKLGDFYKPSKEMQNPFTVPVPELDLMSWSKRKTVHKRSKWFARRIAGVVNSSDKRMLTADFIKVVSVLMRLNQIGKNVSRYNYYIIRLASRRGLTLLIEVSDMCDGYSKNMFDDRLFGSVYRELGWDIDCRCPMFLKWKDT